MSEMSVVRGRNLLPLRILTVLAIGLLVGCRQANDAGSTPPQGTSVGELDIHAPEDVKNYLNGYISTVNGAIPAEPRDADHAVAIPAGQDALLEGWFVYGDGASSGIVMDEVFGLIDGKSVKADAVNRPDVSAHFKNEKVIRSGYRLRLAPKEFGSGVKRVDMIGRVKKDGTLYRFPQPIFLSFP